MGFDPARIFSETARAHGIFAALLVVGILAIIIIAAYAAKARVDLWREEFAAATRERAAKDQQAQRDMQAREAEKQALISSINAARQQNLEIVKESMTRGEAMTKALFDMGAECRASVVAIKEMAVNLQAHREESSARAGKMYEKMGDIENEIARMPHRS